MNCAEFRHSLIEVVRGHAALELHDAALAHAGQCGACQRELERERTLREAFRGLAAGDAREAPGRVEAALVMAIDARISGSKVLPMTAGRRASGLRRWAVWGVAAAAGLALAAFLIRELEPRQVATNPPVTAPKVEAPETPIVAPGTTPVRVAAATVPGQTRVATRKPRKPGPVDQPSEGVDATAGFVPLPYGSAFGPPERAQVLRVTMPGSALAGLGLPVGAERAEEMFRADIVIGDDSIARAIRLVDRNSNSSRVRRASYER